ncbi:MAG: hypothetical protein R3200_12555 [Xanthomonadales bacterium]|nr:hypothetical protein [Xanthomonadales bacterium]
MNQEVKVQIQPEALTREFISSRVDRNGPDAERLTATIAMPIVRKGPETRQNPIRLKSCLKRASDHLRSLGADETWTESLAGIELSADQWRELQRHSAACLLADRDESHLVGIPHSWPEAVWVGKSPWLRPLIQSWMSPSEAAILCLTLEEAWLLQVTADAVWEEKADALPMTLEEAVGGDLDQPSLQHHGAGQQTRFHGQAINQDDRDADLDRFFQAVDAALDATLQTHERLANMPLIVAGTEEVLARFERISSRQFSDRIAGSPPRDRHEDLASTARNSMRERRISKAASRVAAWRELDNGSMSITELAGAAYDGRVEELVVIGPKPVWGRVTRELDVETHGERRDESIDLIDFALRHAWKTGAKVMAVNGNPEQLADLQLAGLLRY